MPVKLRITEQFSDKVEYLCKSVPNIEWSGILFYNVEGSIKEPEKVVLVPIDIFLMDIGTGTFTSYEFDENVVKHMMDNPQLGLMKASIGHIHSHHNMQTFFSGVDMSELHDNVSKHRFYLSLIVNNKLEMTAKVAFLAEANSSEVSYYAQDEKGEPYIVDKSILNSQIMYQYNCQIEKPASRLSVPESFQNRLEAVIESKRQKSMMAERAANIQKNLSSGGATHPFQYPTPLPGLLGPVPEWSKNPEKDWETIKEEEEKEEREQEYEEVIEDYIVYILSVGQHEELLLEDALIEVCAPDVNQAERVKTIIEVYPALFDSFFDESERKNYRFILEEVIAILKEFSEDYSIAKQLSEGLSEILNFEKDKEDLEFLKEDWN